MRSLLLAGAVLAACSTTSANAWTQSLLHPEGRDGVVATAMPVTAIPMPPRYSGTDTARHAAPRRVPSLRTGEGAPVRPSDPPAWPSCPWC